jgi:hypothetical protein
MIMKPSECQIAVRYTNRHSQRNWEDYYEIEFIDRETGALRKTYVSDNNRNFGLWFQLLEHMDNNPNSAVCIEGNFRFVKGKTDVLNADVKFSHVRDFDRDIFMNTIYDEYYA